MNQGRSGFLAETTYLEQLPSQNHHIQTFTVYLVDMHVVSPPVLEFAVCSGAGAEGLGEEEAAESCKDGGGGGGCES